MKKRIVIPETNGQPAWNFSKYETVPLFVEHFAMRTSCDEFSINGLALLLCAIKAQKDVIDVEDFCDRTLRALYTWTPDFDAAENQWWESIGAMESRQTVN